MKRTAPPRVTLLAALLIVAAGCVSKEVWNELESGFTREVRQTEDRVRRVTDTLVGGLQATTDKTQRQLQSTYDTVMGQLKDYPLTPKLVFFRDDAAPSAAARPGKPETATETGPGKPAPPPRPAPREIRSPFLSERTLEHRGLRLLWNLALDGTSIRYADASDGYLYVITKANRLYAIDMKTGLTRWVYDLESRPDTPPGFSDLYIVLSAGDIIRVIDKRLGRDRWRFRTKIQPSSRPFCSSRYFVFGCWTGHVNGFIYGDRHPRWRFKPGKGKGVFAAPYMQGTFVYAASGDGNFAMFNAGSRLTIFETRLRGRPVGDLLGTKDLLYIATENFEMIALRPSDARKSWAHGAGGRPLPGSWLSRTGNVLYYAARDDGLYALSAVSGKTRWRVPNGVRPVALAGGHLFVLRADNSVCKVDSGTGKILWSESIHPFVTAVAHMTSDTLYLISADGQIFAVAPKP